MSDSESVLYTFHSILASNEELEKILVYVETEFFMATQLGILVFMKNILNRALWPFFKL